MIVAVSAAAADLPSGESLIEKFITQSGGADAYAKAKSVSMDGSVEIVGRNITGTVTIVQEGPKSWTSMDFPGIGAVEQGYDGQIAWENSALQGPRIMEGDEKRAVERASSLSVITGWRDIYKEARTEGSADVNGKPAWKVTMVPKDGQPETFYFDKDSGLLVRMATVLSTPLGEIPTEVTISDYRPINGISTPFTMTQTAMNQNIVMKFNKVQYNAPVARDRFDPPAPVKALLAKKGAQGK